MSLSATDKIIALMRFRHDILQKYTLTPAYFLPQDEEAIRSWGEDECERVWEIVQANAKKPLGFTWTGYLNPFCLRGINCLGCEYESLHGLCRHEGSDYTILRKNRIFDVAEINDSAAVHAFIKNLG